MHTIKNLGIGVSACPESPMLHNKTLSINLSISNPLQNTIHIIPTVYSYNL
jgi:hypothetical protein